MQMHSRETNAGVDDLLGAVKDCGLDFLALLKVPVYVFDRHRGFVDEDADREREPAERHDIERFAQRPERCDRAEHGERNRGGDDQRRAEAAEKKRIMTLVSAAAMMPSRMTPPIAALMNID